MQPLVWLLALIPILFAGVRSPWTEDAARWGLRSLKLLSADSWDDFLDPGDVTLDGPLAFEPPLMTWLTAASIWVAGPSQPPAVVLPAALCVFLIVVTSYELARGLGGPWLGLLTAVFLATHPITQQLVQQPTAATMGLTTSLITLWSFYRHLEAGNAVWSRWLWISGLSWGLCLMSSGPLALIAAGICFTFMATAPKGTTTGRRMISLTRKSGSGDWRPWKSLMIALCLGTLVGGWWPLMMGALHGSLFWSTWLGLLSRPGTSIVLSPEVESWLEGSKYWFRHSADLLPLLSGFILLGIWRLFRIVFRHQDPALRRGQHFLFIWMLTALLMWGLSLGGADLMLFQRQLWTAFLLIPLSILAAGGLLEIGERHAGFGATLMAYGCGVFVAVWRYRGSWVDTSKVSHQASLVIALTLIFLLCIWLSRRYIHGNESRQRWLVQSGIWSLLIAHSLWGINFLARGPLVAGSRVEQPLMQFWTDLRTWRADQPHRPETADELILVTSTKQPSSRLQYIAQSVWPYRTLKFATSVEGLAARRAGMKSRIIITYGKREAIRPNTPTESSVIIPIVPPRLYQQDDTRQAGELNAYEYRNDAPDATHSQNSALPTGDQVSSLIAR